MTILIHFHQSHYPPISAKRQLSRLRTDRPVALDDGCQSLPGLFGALVQTVPQFCLNAYIKSFLHDSFSLPCLFFFKRHNSEISQAVPVGEEADRHSDQQWHFAA